jgi:hypothetical protein
VAPLNRLLFRVWYPHEGYLRKVAETPLASSSADPGEAYAVALKGELEGLVRSGEVETHERSLAEAGGPGIEFDAVTLMVQATVVAAGYAAWRVVATDLRALIKKLQKLGDGRVMVDIFGAEVLAVDSLTQTKDFTDFSIRFCAPLRGADDEEYGPDRGFLVGLTVDGVETVVVVGPDGSILGSTTAAQLPGLDKLDL